MKINGLINKNKIDLCHKHHGGEIYNLNNQILDFSTNINPLATPERFSGLYEKIKDKISVYPDSYSSKLKKKIVSYFKDKITIENIIVGAGSMELISNFCDVFINPGDNVVICQPTFSEYEWTVKKNGGKVINYYRNHSNLFRLDVDSISDLMSLKLKAIFICNPNNPNGSLDDRKDLITVIERASKNNALVFIDEAFIEFTGEENSIIPEISSFNNLYISRSFTKFFALTGLRVGFGVAPPDIIKIMENGQLLWSVNCIAQYFARKILSDQEFINTSKKFISEERNFMEVMLKKIGGIKLFPTNTNYILMNIKDIGLKAGELKALLLDKNILIRDCSNYEGLDDYYVRICIKTRESNLKLINNLKSIIGN
ncbi:MAG: pyridoxal phosphate-dependent aminotransferase [Promethearchaeota archaeon]